MQCWYGYFIVLHLSLVLYLAHFIFNPVIIHFGRHTMIQWQQNARSPYKSMTSPWQVHVKWWSWWSFIVAVVAFRKLEGCSLGVWNVCSFIVFLSSGGHRLRSISTGTIYGQELGPEKRGDHDALAPRHAGSGQGRHCVTFHVQSRSPVSRGRGSMVPKRVALQAGRKILRPFCLIAFSVQLNGLKWLNRTKIYQAKDLGVPSTVATKQRK